MIRHLVLMLLLCCAPPAMAADPTGLWALRIGNATMFQIEIRRDGAAWTGTWIRSADFGVDADGKIRTGGPLIRRVASDGRTHSDSSVGLTFDDPRPGAMPDTFRIRAIDQTHAEAYYSGGRMGAIMLVRTTAAIPVVTGPARTFTYAPHNDWPTNAEMTALFDADQGDRRAANIDWSVVGPADERRRARTQQLIDAGALHSGDDFLHAAFVFQHGGGSDAFLKAHLLAMVAIARGNRGAIWIASATLDRYLQSIGQAQVTGTQFMIRDGKASQDPYNRALLSDALRQALNVPPLAEQEEQRKRFERPASSKN